MIMQNNELQHHGIIGMKWGVRRFQNKDGSLTPAGKKRLDKLDSEREKLTGSKSNSSQSKTSSSSAKKKISEMSDDELLKATARRRLETDYLNSERNYNISKSSYDSSTPQKQSRSEKISNLLKTVGNDVVKPAAVNAGRAWLEKTLKDKLGLNEQSSFDKLKKEVDMLDLQVRKKNNLENLKNNDLNKLKRENELYNERKRNDEFKEYFSPKGQADREEKAERERVNSHLKNYAQNVANAQTIYKGRKFFESEYEKWEREERERRRRESLS